MKMGTHRTPAALAAAGAVLAMAFGYATQANAQSVPRLCTWGGSQANPTGIVTLDPGLTNTPSAGPIAVHAWGPLEGPGCHGTMDFNGIGRPGASCLSTTFEGAVYGVPGVTRLFGPGALNVAQEYLYDGQGNIVGSDQPIVKVFGNPAPDSNGLDCNRPGGFDRAPFSSTVEFFT